jgi:hypothetical protein
VGKINRSRRAYLLKGFFIGKFLILIREKFAKYPTEKIFQSDNWST